MDWEPRVQERLLTRMGRAMAEIIHIHPPISPAAAITPDPFQSCRYLGVSVWQDSLDPPPYFEKPNPDLKELFVDAVLSEHGWTYVRYDGIRNLFSGETTAPTFVTLSGAFLPLTHLNLKGLRVLELRWTNFEVSEIIAVICQAPALEDLTISSTRILNHDLSSIPDNLPSVSVTNVTIVLHTPAAHALLTSIEWSKLREATVELIGSHPNALEGVTRWATSPALKASAVHIRINEERVDLGLGLVRLSIHTSSSTRAAAFARALGELPRELLGSLRELFLSYPWRPASVQDHMPEIKALAQACPAVRTILIADHCSLEAFPSACFPLAFDLLPLHGPHLET